MGTSVTRFRFMEAFSKKDIVFFNSSDVLKTFSFKSKNSLKHLLRRLDKDGIIERLARDKYLFLQAKRDISDFEIANFLYSPSYVSLESALSFYGVLAQFPYRISSLTSRKPQTIKARNKTFSFAQIKPPYFKDFIRIDDFLIAERQKAIFDYLYFIFKGLRPKAALSDLKEIISEKEIKKYLLENADTNFLNFLNSYVKL